MTPQELSELKSRCLMAVSQGYQVAHAESRVAELKKIVGDVALPPNPTRALLNLIEMVELGKVAPPKAPPPVVKAPEPVKVAPPPVQAEPEPVVIVEEVAVEELHMPNIGSNIEPPVDLGPEEATEAGELKEISAEPAGTPAKDHGKGGKKGKRY
jgi:hypothetical protein